MGRGDRRGESRKEDAASARRRQLDSRPFVTFGWANSATGEPEHEITLTGEQWDALYMQCLQLTRRGAAVLAGLQVEHIDLVDLTPEKVDGAKLFFNAADLIEYVNEEGERL